MFFARLIGVAAYQGLEPPADRISAPNSVSRSHDPVTPRNNTPLPLEYIDAPSASGEQASRSDQ
jgi:hypothetical protein